MVYLVPLAMVYGSHVNSLVLYGGFVLHAIINKQAKETFNLGVIATQ